MKKRWVVYFSFLLVITLIAGCTRAKEAAPSSENSKSETLGTEYVITGLKAERDYNFFFVCPIIGNPYWDNILEEIEYIDEYFGVHTEIVGPNIADEDRRFEYFRQAVACSPDGIFTIAFQKDEYMEYVKETKENGIAIAFIESTGISGQENGEEPWCFYVGTDNYKAGCLAGETMIEATFGTAKVGILTAGNDTENMSERVRGFKDKLSRNKGMQIVIEKSSGGSLETGMKKVEEMLADHELDAIFGVSATDVIAAARVVEENNRNDIILVGFDDLDATLQYINNEVIFAVIAQRPEEMCWLSIQALIQTIQGEIPKENSVTTDVILVTKENMNDYK